MRIFESLAIISLGVSLLSIFLNKKTKLNILSLSLTELLCIISIIVEGYRIHLLPTVIIGFIHLILQSSVLIRGKKEKTKLVKILLFISNTIFLVIAVILPLLFPVSILPQPTGDYEVGTTLLCLTDLSRDEIVTIDKTDKRELSIQVWYPAENVKGYEKEYFFTDPLFADNFEELLKMPNIFQHLKLTRTHSYKNAPVATSKQPFPVLIFSHGYTGFTGQNTGQMEELASHGYVIFSIGHTYESIAVEFPNDRIVGLDNDIVDNFYNEFQIDLEADLAQEITKLIDQGTLINERVMVWQKDTSFVLDEIEKMNADDMNNLFSHKLDLDKVGVFGHSYGGATAGMSVYLDSRFKVGVNMDGGQFGDLRGVILDKPFLLFLSDESSKAIKAGYNLEQDELYVLEVKGTKHYNFTDISLMSPAFESLGLLGGTSGFEIQDIMNNYLLAFFDEHLKGKQSDLFSKTHHHPKVKLEIYE